MSLFHFTSNQICDQIDSKNIRDRNQRLVKQTLLQKIKYLQSFEYYLYEKRYNLGVRVTRSGLSSFLIFFLFSILSFKLFSFSLFLTPRVRVSDDMGHMAQRRFQKDDIIPRADLMVDTWLFRVGQKWLAWTMRTQYIKVDYSIQGFLSSFLVLPQYVIRREYRQTLGLGLVDRNRTVVIISLQRRQARDCNDLKLELRLQLRQRLERS